MVNLLRISAEFRDERILKISEHLEKLCHTSFKTPGGLRCAVSAAPCRNTGMHTAVVEWTLPALTKRTSGVHHCLCCETA